MDIKNKKDVSDSLIIELKEHLDIATDAIKMLNLMIATIENKPCSRLNIAILFQNLAAINPFASAAFLVPLKKQYEKEVNRIKTALKNAEIFGDK